MQTQLTCWYLLYDEKTELLFEKDNEKDAQKDREKDAVNWAIQIMDEQDIDDAIDAAIDDMILEIGQLIAQNFYKISYAYITTIT